MSGPSAKRLAAVRAAAARHGYAAWSTGPRSAQGKRRASANATRHGCDSLAFRLAIAYAEAVVGALSAPTGTSLQIPRRSKAL
jgi:hypothetical protein